MGPPSERASKSKEGRVRETITGVILDLLNERVLDRKDMENMMLYLVGEETRYGTSKDIWNHCKIEEIFNQINIAAWKKKSIDFGVMTEVPEWNAHNIVKTSLLYVSK